MNMRKIIAVIISIISIRLLALTNVSASYMPTNPIDKDVDGQPAGEEYKDKFEFVLKDPEGNLLELTVSSGDTFTADIQDGKAVILLPEE